MASPATPIDRSCGPSGCETDWLSSRRHEAPLDAAGFVRFAEEQGWGDGLPLIPPTEEQVQAHIVAGRRFPDEVIAVLPPLRSEATAEKIAINAVMAGAPAEAMPLIYAAIAAMAESQFDLAGLNATTGSVVPAMIVNGPARHDLRIPMGAGLLGGADGWAPSIGRAIRLAMRNVAGQHVGTTSKSVYGNPARVAGMLFAEWEEMSPWAPLAERRGIAGDAVTIYGAMGSINVCDVVADSADGLLDMIGRSLAYPGANGFLPSTAYSEALVLINPVWADVIGQAYPDIRDVQQRLWEQASLPIGWFRPEYRGALESLGHHTPDDRIHLCPKPEDILVVVAGGEGGLHAHLIHSWGTCLSVTRAIPEE
jgi:hypothetical protein